MTYSPFAAVQNSGIGEGSKSDRKESNSFSNELASTINDGLYFYEQVEATTVLIH